VPKHRIALIGLGMAVTPHAKSLIDLHGRLLDRKSWTLVNRGFVPHDRKDPAKRTEGQLGSVVEIVGLMRSPQVQSWFDGENDERANVWYVRDPFEVPGAAKCPLVMVWTGERPPGRPIP
jgi:cytochrome oxidase assembly protein ShyY1